MEITIQSIQFEAKEKLEEFIEKKVSKLEKFCEELQKIHVQLRVVKPATAQNKEVSFDATVPGKTIHVDATSDTFEESVDLCVDAMKVSLQKYKEKLREH